MKQLITECEYPPPHEDVEYKCLKLPGSKLYDHELVVDPDTELRRRVGVTVKAQTFYEARQKGAIELGLSPEHVCVIKGTSSVESVEQWSEVG